MKAVAYGGDRGGASPPFLAPKVALASGNGLLDLLPVGVYMADREGRIVQFNRRAVELWGKTPEPGQTRFCGAHLAFDPHTGHPLVESPVEVVLRSGESVRSRAVLLERPDGSRVTILLNADPVLDDRGVQIGAAASLQDITDYKRANDALHPQEQSFRDMLEALPVALYTTDADGTITYFNQAAEKLAGRRPTIGEDKWCVTWKLYTTDGAPLPHDVCPLAQELKNNQPVIGAEAIVERPDGSRISMMPFPTPLRDETGKMVGGVNILVDISERKRAEEQESTLVNELNHRVKNTLATVQSLAAQTIRGAGVNSQMQEDFEARLLALSRVHDQLSRERWKAADFGELVHDVFAPHASLCPGRVETSGPSVSLRSQAALSLSMVLHELAANAAKYGALSELEGRVRVTWSLTSRDGRQRLGIEWSETGGPAVIAPQRQGFGLRLLKRSVKQQLQGDVEIAFEGQGFRCKIDVPIQMPNNA